MKCFLRDLIDNMLSLVQIMAWRRIGDKPLSEPVTVYFTDAYMRPLASMSKRCIARNSYSAYLSTNYAALAESSRFKNISIKSWRQHATCIVKAFKTSFDYNISSNILLTYYQELKVICFDVVARKALTKVPIWNLLSECRNPLLSLIGNANNTRDSVHDSLWQTINCFISNASLALSTFKVN